MAKLRLQKLREEVLQANLELVRRGLVLYTFGNVSGISREDELVVIRRGRRRGNRFPALGPRMRTISTGQFR